eukprot:114911-Pyramimonas_sp.AAC.1
MPRDQQQSDSLLERRRSYAHTAERPPDNIGGIFSRGRRAETFRAEANAGQPATNVRNGDSRYPQATETTALLAQNGGSVAGSQESRARCQGPSATAAPAQTMAL